MNKLSVTTLLCLSGLWAQSAAGQTSLGELLDKGATKVLRAEWQSLLPLTLSGVTMTGTADFEMTVKADGSFRGTSASRQGYGTSPNWGFWRMDDSGRFCVDENFPKWNLQQTTCGYFYKLDDRYYRSDLDGDRDAPVAPRAFKKG